MLLPAYAVWADEMAECKQSQDSDRQLHFCTAVIEQENQYIAEDRSAAYFIRAEANKIRDVEGALADLDEAIALNTKNVDAYLLRSEIYHGRNDYDRAITALTTLINRKLDDGIAYINRAGLYLRQGKYDLAIADYTKLIEINPNNSHARSMRAWAYTKKGDYSNAVEDFTKQIEIAPDAKSYSARAWSYLKSGKPELAVSDVERAAELEPDDASVLETRGQIYAALGRQEEAIADLDKALSLDPTRAIAREELEKLRPGSDAEHRKLCESIQIGGESTIWACTLVIEKDASNPKAYSNRALAYISNEDYDRAILDLDAAIRLSPDEPSFYLRRAQAYEAKGNGPQADADFAKAQELLSR